MPKIKIGVVGCCGRMGRALLREIIAEEGCQLAGGTERGGHDCLGQDLGAVVGLEPAGINVTDDPDALIQGADAILDFTTAAATALHAGLAARYGACLIAGTTGLTPDQENEIAQAARKTAIVRAANMSVGVNILLQLTRQVSALLGEDFDIEIVEMHHRDKADAPSGTALALGEAAAEGRNIDFKTAAIRGRDGLTGPRLPGKIGLAALRGGNVAGDHTVIFAGSDERIELTHKAGDRAIFARGALRAALWATDKPPGLYSFADVLGFTNT